MSIITIPKQLTDKDELVAISKREYVEFLKLRSLMKEVKPTRIELRAIEKGRDAIKKGDFINLNDLKKELGF